MVFWTIIELLLASTVILWAIYNYFFGGDTPKGLKPLPGPTGLPVGGMMPFMGKNSFKTITKLGEKYGELFQLRIGFRKVIVLNSDEVIREALTNDWAFAGRPLFPSRQAFIHSGGQSRFAFRPANSMWKFLRKSAVKALGMFASSKSSKLQAIVDESGETFHQKIEKKLGQAYNPQQDIFNCVAGVIGRVNFGADFKADDPLLREVIKLTQILGPFFEFGSILDYLPFGQWIMKWKINNFVKAIEPINQFTERQIKEHECSDDVRDIADALYKTAKETPEEEKKALHITDDQIRYISQDLFGAGFATTMETFQWALNLLALSPEVQGKIQSELDSICADRRPTLEDRDSLPYCEAVLLEVLRFSSLVPFAVPHMTQEKTSLRGYYIPKDALVLVNLYGQHRNPKTFPEPNTFKPDRFLTETGSLELDLAQKVIPFGVGKRRCVGENMARQELFLLIAQTFQHFTVAPAPGVIIDVNDCIPGLFRRPLNFNVVFTKRNL